MDVDSEVGNGGPSEMEEIRGGACGELVPQNLTENETCPEGARETLRDGNGNNEQEEGGDRNDNGEGGSESKAKDESQIEEDSAMPEMINLMPDSDDDTDASENPNSEVVTFKKRKTSHSLRNSLRRRGQDESSSSSSSDEEVPEVEPMAVSSPLQMPDLTSGEEEGEANRTREGGSSSSRREIPPLTSSEGEDDDRRKERVRARRVVRAEDLVTVEGEGEEGGQRSSSSSSSSDTDEDGTPSATFISEKAREVIFKPISASKHSVLSDLASRQMGLRMKPTFTSRRCGSADLVKRFKLAAKLSGHEGCVNCLNFNQVLGNCKEAKNI